ncbi:MAG: helix-turn-helix transcriptional regulator [Desulfovibrio sp.]|nr:helix-turn-helix transcriptional regulator [Desulfovibrio sp.]
MAPTETGHARYAAPSSSARQRHLAAVLMLALFYVTHNIGAVFFQARGVLAGHTSASLLGYLAGVLLGALAFDALERRMARKPDGRGGAALHACLLAALLLPGLFCLTSFLIVPYSANLALNALQPLLWGATLPVALRLFFQHAEPERQALFFGIGVGAGHLAWALLMPLALSFADGSVIAGTAGTFGAAVLTDALHTRFLPFLNMARVLSNCAIAALAWYLVRFAPCPEPYPEVRQAFEPDGHRELGDAARPGGAGRIFRLLPPLILCFTVSGMLGYLFFARMLARGIYAEYMHLGLVALFPLCGLLLSRHGTALLRPLLCASVLCFAAAPLLQRPDSPPALIQGMFMVCSAGQQALFFFGALALSRFTPYTRHPALTLSLPWLAAFAAIPGNLLASRLLPALGLSPYPAVWGLAGLCLLSLFVLRRAFPLPVAAALQQEDKETPAAMDNAVKLAAFVTAFRLTAKETEVMAALSAWVEPASIAQSLGLSERTVRHHLTNIGRKVGTTNRKGLELFYAAWRP